MATKRKPTAPTTEAIDQFCAAFDDLFARYEERTALRQYLIGLLLPARAQQDTRRTGGDRAGSQPASAAPLHA